MVVQCRDGSERKKDGIEVLVRGWWGDIVTLNGVRQEREKKTRSTSESGSKGWCVEIKQPRPSLYSPADETGRGARRGWGVEEEGRVKWGE